MTRSHGSDKDRLEISDVVRLLLRVDAEPAQLLRQALGAPLRFCDEPFHLVLALHQLHKR